MAISPIDRIRNAYARPGAAPTGTDEPREPSPRERIAAGLAAEGGPGERARLQRLAASYDPALDAEAERLARIPALHPSARMAVGYQQQARQAAEALAALDAEYAPAGATP